MDGKEAKSVLGAVAPTKKRKQPGKSRIKPVGGDKSFYMLWPKEDTWMCYIAGFLGHELDDSGPADQFLHQMKTCDKMFHDEKSFYGNPPAREVMWLAEWQYAYAGTKHPAQPLPDFMKATCRRIEDFVHDVVKNVENKVYPKTAQVFD